MFSAGDRVTATSSAPLAALAQQDATPLPPPSDPVFTPETDTYSSLRSSGKRGKSDHKPLVDVVIVPSKTHFDERSTQQFQALVLKMIAQKGTGTDYAELRKLVGQHDDWGINIIAVHEVLKTGQGPTVIARPSERRLKPDEFHPAMDSSAYQKFMGTPQEVISVWAIPPPEGVEELVSPEGNLVVRIGSSDGQKYEIISPDGFVIEDGRLLAFDGEFDASYHVKRYGYDKEGRLIKVTNYAEGRLTLIEYYTYDSDGAPYRRTDRYFREGGSSIEEIFEWQNGSLVWIAGEKFDDW